MRSKRLELQEARRRRAVGGNISTRLTSKEETYCFSGWLVGFPGAHVHIQLGRAIALARRLEDSFGGTSPKRVHLPSISF